MNSPSAGTADRLERARTAAAAVTDPELPDLTIAELGMLRGVTDRGGVVVVTVTPTFSACPAISAILADLDRALSGAAVAPYAIETSLRPPWSSAWITPAGREGLRRAGIAPPPSQPDGGHRRVDVTIGPAPADVTCPRCGSPATSLLSVSAATACRSLRRCESCREPFDAIKAV